MSLTATVCRYRECDAPVDPDSLALYCRPGHRSAEFRAHKAEILAASAAQRVEAARILREEATEALLVGDLEGALRSIRDAEHVLARTI